MDITTLNLSLGLVLLAIITASLGADLEIRCDEGDWIQGHRGCYYFEMELKRWSEAKQDCQDRGGFLLSIGSVAELRYIKTELKPMIKDMNHLKWWVGLEADKTLPGRWRWADGGEFNHRVSPWGPGEPNNAGNKEHCVELNYKGKLNDADCQDTFPYVCENMGRTTTSEPTSIITTTGVLPVETHLSTVQKNTKYGERMDTVRRRDTKGPAIRITTPNLPEAPSPGPTDELFIPSTRTETSRISDINSDYTTPSAALSSTSEAKPSTSHAKTTEETLKKFCDPTNADGLQWPQARTGSTARVQCANGVAKWTCHGQPAEWIGRPDISDCVSPVLKMVFAEVMEKNDETPTKVSAKKVAKAVSSLANITRQKSLTPQEVVMTTRALSTLATKVDLKNSTVEEIKDVVSSVVKTTSNLLSTNKTSTWSELPKKDQRDSAASLLVGVETSAMAIAEVIDQPQVIKKKDANIELELRVFGPKELLEQPEIVFGTEESVDEFVLPSDMLKDNNDEGLTKIVFVTYHKIADLLQPETEKSEISRTEDGETYVPAVEKLLVSNVISVSVHGKTFQNLKTPIKFTMKQTREYPPEAIPSCVFWKFAMDSGISGSWSDDGCKVYKSNSSHTVCQCNHLTNFAVLMDVQRVQIPDVHKMSLQLITYVGCIVSAVCLVVSWLTFQFLKCLQGERNSIHKNLVFCLFVAEMLFLFGIDKTYNKILCSVLAGLMHYFFLASFTWMFLEGVHIVVMIVQVFDAAKSRLKWYYLAGYGIPLTVVSVSAAINYQGYGTEYYCWLSVENLFIWSFAGPIAVILLVNATILTYAMSTVCKHSEYVIKEKNRSDSTRAWIQGALALEVLLGLTWVFGYFYINQETIVMAYVFTILNSLQGLFIFCFHCLLNKKVRKEYKRVLDISRVTTSTNTRSATRSSLHRKQDPSYEMYDGSH